MKRSYLQVTYRRGRPLAAYYYLPRRDGDRSVRTERAPGGFVVDFAADGRPIGIELVSPAELALAQFNQLLSSLGQETVVADDLAPLVAA